MIALSPLQIELIRGDIRQNGVELIDLQEDLLDHVCCAIEEESSPGLSFEEMYQQIRTQLFPDGYREIQETTNELIAQKFEKMKKTMNIFGAAGSALLLVGSVMKVLHLVAANELLTLGVASIVFVYVPLMLTMALKQTDTAMGRIRNISGYLGANLIVVGILFEVLHFAGGNQLLLAGLIIFMLLFVPLFFKSVGKDAILKIQPATLSVLLIAIVSALFAFNNKQPSMSYVNSMLSISNNLEQAYQIKETRLATIRTADTALSKQSDKTVAYIESLKRYLVSQVDPKSTDGRMSTYNLFNTQPILNEIMMGTGSNNVPNGKKLHQHVVAYLDILSSTDPSLKTIISNQDKGKTWMETHFNNKPLHGIYTTLTNFQLEIATLELEAIADSK